MAETRPAKAGEPAPWIVAALIVVVLRSRRRNPQYSAIDRPARAHAADLCYIPAPMARWQSGYAAACKAADTGSIPVLASILRCLSVFDAQRGTNRVQCLGVQPAH